MDIEEIKQLIELLGSTDISELSVETNGVKISIKKGTDQGHGQQPPVQPHATSLVEGTMNPTPDEVMIVEEETSEELTSVPAPMVGTFYRAPDPEAEPYVKVGDLVQVGQPLCIIEAMKLMNEIESEVKGRIVRILVEDGEPVQYGEPLFLIGPES